MKNIKHAKKSAALVSAILAASMGTAHGASVEVGNTTITAGGYVKADFIYDFDQDLGDTFFVDAIDGSDPDGGFSFAATESRVNLTSVSQTSMGEITGFIEGNFQIADDFNLRHAYIEWEGLLLGQTWSNWMPLTSYPATVDFFGPVGILFARNPQVRYTVKEGDLTFAVSAEQREESGNNSGPRTFSGEAEIAGNNGNVDNTRNEIPDLTARIEYNRNGVHLMASGIVRQIAVDFNNGDDDSETGFGINGSALLPIGPDSISANVTWGEGIGGLLVDVVPGFYVDAGGDLNAVETLSGTAAYTRNWSEKYVSNLVFGVVDVDDDFAGDATETLMSVHANLFYTPVEPLTFGSEIMWGDKETFDGSIDEDAVRLQFSAKYSF